jgi:hypothetical protein
MEDTYCFKKKRGTFLLSELNGIVYNFNANFACPIIKIKCPATISKV